jgi:hypothetical protein
MPGGSWKTGLMGYLIIALDVIQFIAQAIEKQGMPTSLQGWIITLSGLAGGIGMIVAKDFDKSNSRQPVAESVTVPAKPPVP